MNILEFEVHNQILTRIDSQEVINENENVYECCFLFEEDCEWSDINKFVIFKDGWGNTSTLDLGKEGQMLSCKVPDKMLRGSYFQVSIYGGDLNSTNTVSIVLVQSGYSLKRPTCPPPRHPILPKPHLHNPRKEDIFVRIFDRLEGCVNNIILEDNTLKLFGKSSLIEEIYLPFLSKDEIDGFVHGLVNQVLVEGMDTASEESDGLLSKEDKVKLDNLSTIALTGDYADLNNIPTEFNPSRHNHVIDDVSDYEDTFNYDLNLVLDLLSDEIRKN